MSLVPNSFVVVSEAYVEDAIHLRVRGRAEAATCSSCGLPSRRIHSRYVRKVSDLPCSGRAVHLQVLTRRFCCQAPQCPRRIFAERFDETDLGARSRRTTRLEGLVHHLGLALGGRPAAAFATRLMVPVSNDTLLRVVRRRARPRVEPLATAGIDDWAFRRNHRYGSIVVDGEHDKAWARADDGRDFWG